jgi:hypothetical protein
MIAKPTDPLTWSPYVPVTTMTLTLIGLATWILKGFF